MHSSTPGQSARRSVPLLPLPYTRRWSWPCHVLAVTGQETTECKLRVPAGQRTGTGTTRGKPCLSLSVHHRRHNPEIPEGRTLVVGTQEGLLATAEPLQEEVRLRSSLETGVLRWTALPILRLRSPRQDLLACA